jgi:hypothetical protein
MRKTRYRTHVQTSTQQTEEEKKRRVKHTPEQRDRESTKKSNK